MNKRVLVVGSAEQSGGGVSSVIKLMKKMPVWEKYHCYWLGTQIQRNYLWKLWYAVKGNIIAFFILWRYDIVHFHTVPDKICLIIQLPIFLLALIERKKIIMHIHMGNQLRNHTTNKLFKWCLNKSDLIILLAKKWQKLFADEYSDIETKTTVLYNVCEEVPEVSHDEKDKIIIMAAFFNDNKAPDILLKAWAKIKDRFPDWQIYMLGNGEVERFSKMSDDMGLAERVHFTGYIVGPEKENFFCKASIYCMCSYEEGFPMVVLEAWAYGINVVTTPVGGLPDVLEEGKNALTFEFGDAEGLAYRLSELMDNDKQRREMADYSRKFVLDHFSMEKINEDIDAVYRSLYNSNVS